MLELIVVVARLAQYAAATVLFGSPLLFIYGLPRHGPGAAEDLTWPRSVLLGVAGLAAVAAAVSLSAQTAVMAASFSAAFDLDALGAVLAESQFGFATAARFSLAILATLALATLRPARGLWLALTALGAAMAASFAWSGHGASDQNLTGSIHLISDIIHLWAAAIWLGALAALALLLASPSLATEPAAGGALHHCLRSFSGLGSTVVAILLATGLINSWFLIGPAHMIQAIHQPYGLILIAKLGLFAVMLGLAGINRFRLTPRLGQSLGDSAASQAAVAALRRSVWWESLTGLAVLILVSVLGTLAPPGST